jgi:hypothetical protein
LPARIIEVMNIGQPTWHKDTIRHLLYPYASPPGSFGRIGRTVASEREAPVLLEDLDRGPAALVNATWSGRGHLRVQGGCRVITALLAHCKLTGWQGPKPQRPSRTRWASGAADRGAELAEHRGADPVHRVPTEPDCARGGSSVLLVRCAAGGYQVPDRPSASADRPSAWFVMAMGATGQLGNLPTLAGLLIRRAAWGCQGRHSRMPARRP